MSSSLPDRDVSLFNQMKKIQVNEKTIIQFFANLVERVECSLIVRQTGVQS